jgi:hypothetical protein
MVQVWCQSRDAVPEHVTQITICDEATGSRVATVFNKEAANAIEVAPQMLRVVDELLYNVNGLNATMRSADGKYAASPLCLELTKLVKLARDCRR